MLMIRNEKKGLTLVEAMAATLIVAIAAVAFAGLSGSLSLGHKKTSNKEQARLIAESKLNEMRSNKTVLAQWIAAPSQESVSQGNVEYHIYKQVTPMESSLKPSPFTNDNNAASVQAIVLLPSAAANTPYIYSVTVTWGG